MSLTETLGSSLTAGFGGGGGLEGVDSTGGFLGLAGVLAPMPLTGLLSCVPLPIFSLMLGRAPAVGVDLFGGIDIVCAFESGSLSLAVLTAGGGGGGMEGWALLCDSTVLLMRAHSNRNVSDRENELKVLEADAYRRTVPIQQLPRERKFPGDCRSSSC